MNETTTPILLWLRRDLRLGDHPAMAAAAATGRPVIPVFVHDETVETLGACPKWRLGLGIAALADSLAGIGSTLILRRGRAAEVLAGLVAETRAGAVWWTQAYDPEGRARDSEVAETLGAQSVETRAHPGHLLFEPWSVETGQGGPYKVFTPYWNNIKTRDVGAVLPAPRKLAAPERWPGSDALDDWAMGGGMDRGAGIVARHVTVGEAAARDRLMAFAGERIDSYDTARDFPAQPGTSGLSENLAWGEISVRSCWQVAQRVLEEGRSGAGTFLKELGWREFAYHLMWHTPRITSRNWRPEWDAFPWSQDAGSDHVRAWQQGRTGIPFVDAAMREMYVTGRMHNRARMIVASYLTKHLMTHWRIGADWFADCLVDWDPANNAMGWQWAAGSGPDAAPFFRVFNPVSQLARFDPEGVYAARWIAEREPDPHRDALAFFDAVPRRWGLSPDMPYPDPVMAPAEGRARALAAYQDHRG